MRQLAQSPLRRWFGSRTFLVLALIAATLTALGFARSYYQDYVVRQEIKRLRSEVKLLETKKIESLQLLKYVSSPVFIEDKARSELNLKKPNEEVLVITKNLERESISTQKEVKSADLNNLAKWWYYFTAHKLPI